MTTTLFSTMFVYCLSWKLIDESCRIKAGYLVIINHIFSNWVFKSIFLWEKFKGSSIAPDVPLHGTVIQAAQLLHLPSFYGKLQNMPHVGSQDVLHFLPVHILLSLASLPFKVKAKLILLSSFSGKAIAQPPDHCSCCNAINRTEEQRFKKRFLYFSCKHPGLAYQRGQTSGDMRHRPSTSLITSPLPTPWIKKWSWEENTYGIEHL